MSTTPQTVRTWGLRTVAFSGPLAIAIMLSWSVGLLPVYRPILVLMLYLLALIVAVAGGLAAVGASCHMAIARAFSAGVRVGQSNPQALANEPTLRLVE